MGERPNIIELYQMNAAERHNISYRKIRDYLAKEVLPFWSTTGLYPNGCFVEHFDMAGAPVDPGFTRVRVQARQIYVFSNAHQAGIMNSASIIAKTTDFLINSAWLGPDRGWAKLISRDGSLIDPSSDLYDISFALFALAWAHRVNPDSRYPEIAYQTLDFLNRHMKHPDGGFHNDAERSFPRQQNPHMHLTEAMNAWADVDGDCRFLAVASQILELFITRFTDSRTGALGEFFEQDWTPVKGHEGSIVEPGHQFEWAWIIGHYGRLSNRPHHDVMRRIINFGMKHGFNAEHGFTIDQVGRDGSVISANRRLWPQTETLKAFVAATEFLGERHDEEIAKVVDTIFSRFLRPASMNAGWIDHFDSNWTPIVNKIPTSSLYHLTLAFFEILRLQPKSESVP